MAKGQGDATESLEMEGTESSRNREGGPSWTTAGSVFGCRYRGFSIWTNFLRIKGLERLQIATQVPRAVTLRRQSQGWKVVVLAVAPFPSPLAGLFGKGHLIATLGNCYKLALSPG